MNSYQYSTFIALSFAFASCDGQIERPDEDTSNTRRYLRRGLAMPSTSLMNKLPDGALCTVEMSCGMCENGFILAGDGVQRCGSERENGENCHPDTTCFLCENGGNYWPLADEYRCGTEPSLRLEDGTPCDPASSCSYCANSHSFWTSAQQYRCGQDSSAAQELADGDICDPSYTCSNCENGSILAGDGNHRCGSEWADGTNCNPGSTCFLCENGGNVWPLADEYRCGTEPAPLDGEPCNPSSTCSYCENGSVITSDGYRCGRELADGTNCNPSDTCFLCENGGNYWPLADEYRCGTEPVQELADGEICYPSFTCLHCENGSILAGDGNHRCGSEWADGTNCNPNNTCFLCENGGNAWPLADEYRCGTEPPLELADGTPCDPSSTCSNCENYHNFWSSAQQYRCGQEPNNNADPQIDPVLVCVTYGNADLGNAAWSVRTDSVDGDIIAQGPKSGQDDNCYTVDIEVGRKHFFSILDRNDSGEVTGYVSNNGSIIVAEILAVPQVQRVEFVV